MTPRWLWTHVGVPTLCVTVWISLSCGVILYNKYLLAYANFPYPVTLTVSAGQGGLACPRFGMVFGNAPIRLVPASLS